MGGPPSCSAPSAAAECSANKSPNPTTPCPRRHPERRFSSWIQLLPVSYSIFAALIGTQSVIFSKSLSVLIIQAFNGNNQLGNWYAWVTLLCFITAAMFWTIRLNKVRGQYRAWTVLGIGSTERGRYRVQDHSLCQHPPVWLSSNVTAPCSGGLRVQDSGSWFRVCAAQRPVEVWMRICMKSHTAHSLGSARYPMPRSLFRCSDSGPEPHRKPRPWCRRVCACSPPW